MATYRWKELAGEGQSQKQDNEDPPTEVTAPPDLGTEDALANGSGIGMTEHHHTYQSRSGVFNEPKLHRRVYD